MRPSVERGPVDLARVLALEEKGLGLASRETEDLAVATDVELALYIRSASAPRIVCSIRLRQVFALLHRDSGNSTSGGAVAAWRDGGTHLARVDLLAAEGIVVGTHVGGFGVIPVC